MVAEVVVVPSAVGLLLDAEVTAEDGEVCVVVAPGSWTLVRDDTCVA